jgi:GPH family glycoside/pentoside/hexuronide:cation symporter
MPAAATTVKAADRAPSIKVDLSYALISAGSTSIWSIISGWLLYFYLPPAGEGVALVPAAFYGATMLIIRAVNAAIALPIGYLSDRTRTRWGRRLPFMFVSGLPMLVCFTLLWRPPVAGTSVWNLIYLGTILLLYNVAYTLNQVPYTALLPEIAQTDRHRIRISAWSSGAFLVGMILGGVGGPVIERFGFATAALLYGVATLPLFYLPFLVLRERSGQSVNAAQRLDFRAGIQMMFRNRAFRVMTAAGLCYWGVTTIVQAVIPFIVTEICRLSKSETFDFYIPALVASLLCYPAITWLSNRVGKWRVFAGSLLASAFVLPGLMLIGPRLSLGLKAQGLVWVTVQAIVMSGVTMLPPAFGAEITDHDEALTGERREGIYYATWGFLDQVTQGVGAAILPLILLLGRSQTDPNGPLGVRMVGVLGGVLMLIGFFVFLKYPLRGRSVGEGAKGGVPDARG